MKSNFTFSALYKVNAQELLNKLLCYVFVLLVPCQFISHLCFSFCVVRERERERHKKQINSEIRKQITLKVIYQTVFGQIKRFPEKNRTCVLAHVCVYVHIHVCCIRCHLMAVNIRKQSQNSLGAFVYYIHSHSQRIKYWDRLKGSTLNSG